MDSISRFRFRLNDRIDLVFFSHFADLGVILNSLWQLVLLFSVGFVGSLGGLNAGLDNGETYKSIFLCMSDVQLKSQ